MSVCFSDGAPVFDIMSYGVLMDQLAELKLQASSLKQELSQLAANKYMWSDASNLINELGDVVSEANSLSYKREDLAAKFKEAFPGYKAPDDYTSQYQKNMDMSQTTLSNILESMGTNARDFQSESARLSFLQNQVQSAEGQTQAIQASAQIASETVSELQLLRQTMIAESNAEITYYATQLQNEASANAELNSFISNGSTKIPGYGTSGEPLLIPDLKRN